MNNLSQLFLALFALVFCFSSCVDGSETLDPCQTDFDQKALFQNVADNLIIPSYAAFQNKVTDVENAVNSFVENTNETTLAAAQDAHKAAYISWQSVAQYEFGPAEEVFLRNSLNNFPLDVDALQSNIIDDTYDLTQAAPDAYDRGFPALDYLLFGTGETQEEIVNRFSNNELATANKNYLSAIVNDIQIRTNHTYSSWTKGDYYERFLNNTGTAAGTSLSLIVNSFNQNYELIKREKLGVPSGVLSQGFTQADRVEALYSGISVELATAAILAAEQYYSGNTGQGLDDLLEAIGARKGEMTLNQAIKTQFSAAINAIKNLDNNLSEMVENDTENVIAAYNEVTKNLVNVKTDMPSVMCVSITYIDNPSDND